MMVASERTPSSLRLLNVHSRHAIAEILLNVALTTINHLNVHRQIFQVKQFK